MWKLKDNQKEANRFWSRVITGIDGHWLFKKRGKNKRNIHGVYLISNKLLGAHQVAWLLSGKAIEYGKVLINTCQCKECINPNHMEYISNSQFSKERQKKYWDKKGRKSLQEKRKTHNKHCRNYIEKNRERYRSYQAAYHREWYKKNKLKTTSQL